MSNHILYQLLEDFKKDRINIHDAVEQLQRMPYEDLGFALVDHHRAIRKGFPEVIFCQGKTPEQVAKIFHALYQHNKTILGTRASTEIFHAVSKIYPEAVYNEVARTIVIQKEKSPQIKGNVLIISAGTTDLPVAEEAAITAEAMGNHIKKMYDVGVAGIHRLLDKLVMLQWAHVIIVIAGMEGALASVVGGLTDRPVIAVPSSIGYGVNFQGLSALLGMLTSCASGISVVNIDNGFGAAAMATAITSLLPANT